MCSFRLKLYANTQPQIHTTHHTQPHKACLPHSPHAHTQPHISCAPHLFCFATPAPHRHTIVSHITRACPHHILPHFRLPYFDCPRIESNRHFEPTHTQSLTPHTSFHTHIFSHTHLFTHTSFHTHARHILACTPTHSIAHLTPATSWLAHPHTA